MKKRSLALLLASVMVISLAGCGKKAEEPAAPAETEAPAEGAGEEAGEEGGSGSEQVGGELVVYSPNSEGLINATIPLFEEKYGITVEVIQAGTGELVKRIESEKNDPYADNASILFS